MLRRLTVGMALTALLSVPTFAASPAPVEGPLPDGQKPWWPSRYGQEDQIGTLNEVTPAAVRGAAGLVRRGVVVDLGRVLDDDTPKFPGRYWHQTVDASPHFVNSRRPDAHGSGWGRNEINWVTEIQTGTFQVGTQLDSIGHIQIGDRFYNGWTTKQVVEEWGLNRYGMETVPPVITRGVLLDIARLKGVARLEKGYVITVADVESAVRAQSIEVHAGDAVLFHTGWGSLYGRDNGQFLSGEPGPGIAVVNWLYARRVALTGADTWSFGAVPGEDPERPFLVPQTMYAKLGFFGLENLKTEALAQQQVYEFMFVLTHAKTRGSTAAVVAPAAIY